MAQAPDPLAALADETLIARIARREGASIDEARLALEVLVNRYGRRVLGLLRTYRPGEASDLAQETWLRVWTRAASFKEGHLFRPWLFQIAKNLAFDHGRRTQAMPPTLSIASSDEPVSFEDPVRVLLEDEERASRANRLHDCLSRLQKNLRTVAEAMLRGESTRQIAQLVQTSESYVENLRFKARTSLRDCLEREEAAS